MHYESRCSKQMTSNCSKTNKVASNAMRALMLPNFDVNYDSFPNRCVATWNLLVFMPRLKSYNRGNEGKRTRKTAMMNKSELQLLP